MKIEVVFDCLTENLKENQILIKLLVNLYMIE